MVILLTLPLAGSHVKPRVLSRRMLPPNPLPQKTVIPGNMYVDFGDYYF
jgi:hypothetical protein